MVDLFDTRSSPLLTWITFFPAAGAVLALFVPANRNSWHKGIAFLSTLASCLLAVGLYVHFPRPATGVYFVHKADWIPYFHIQYFMGVDGVSVMMVILSALIGFLGVISSWNFEEWKVSRGIKGYFILYQLLCTGMTGVFCALDFFLFYVFWEVVLLPMYFLIGIWGGPRREYAAIKFFLYTLAGSVLMLVVMLALYINEETFDILELHKRGREFTGNWWLLAFVGLFIAFAVKIPSFPFHTWLPDAHVEAPTPISVILAAVLLKMGTYGIMRISYPILPEAARTFAPWMLAFGVVSIVYGALCSMAQIRGVWRTNSQTGERYLERDWKKLIAYSSVSHMGYAVIGLAACNPAGLSGAMFEMWSHGIITGALFMIVGVIYDRAHHRDIAEFGGLWSRMPYYGGITAVMFMASLGLPGMSGFVSEVLCFLGAFTAGSDTVTYWGYLHGHHYFRFMTAASVTGVVLGAAYFLWSYQKIFLGPLNEKYRSYTDLSLREFLMLAPLVVLAVAFGVYPAGFLDLVQASMEALAGQVGMPWMAAR